MFTFGRDHERKSAMRYVRNAENAARAAHVSDAIHDCLEGLASKDDITTVVRTAIVDGGSGVR